jgi:hypothetical protein
MASGRPRRPNDQSVMASVESALRSTVRPGIFGLLWNWRYELGLITGLAAVVLASGYALGAAWLVAIAAIGLAGLTVGLAWPPSRRRLITRAWCVITPHRIRTGCKHAWIQTRDGRLPIVLYTTPAAFGERVTLWCRAGITSGDLEGARDILRAACWASDVRVVASARYAHVVVLEVIRHLPAQPPHEAISPWPHASRNGEGDGAGPEEPAPDEPAPDEPALHGGRGYHGPFG